MGWVRAQLYNVATMLRPAHIVVNHRELHKVFLVRQLRLMMILLFANSKASRLVLHCPTRSGLPASIVRIVHERESNTPGVTLAPTGSCIPLHAPSLCSKRRRTPILYPRDGLTNRTVVRPSMIAPKTTHIPYRPPSRMAFSSTSTSASNGSGPGPRVPTCVLRSRLCSAAFSLHHSAPCLTQCIISTMHHTL